MALADMLKLEAAKLKHMTQSAALSGNWSTVARIVKVAEGAYGWPIAKELTLLLLSNTWRSTQTLVYICRFYIETSIRRIWH